MRVIYPWNRIGSILCVFLSVVVTGSGTAQEPKRRNNRQPPSTTPVRVETIQPQHKAKFQEDSQRHVRRQGGRILREGELLIFTGSEDGDRQVDPQIAVGGGYVLHGTNGGLIIFDKAGQFVQGVTQGAFNGGIDPKLFFDRHNRVFGFDLWDPWDKEKKKPVNISISETDDPRGVWNTYPVPAPEGRDGGGIGYSRKWIGYSFPGGPEQTFVLRMDEAKAGKPATVFHFSGNIGHPVQMQDAIDELYFLIVTDRQFIIRRIEDAGDGTPKCVEVSAAEHKLEYVGFPPQSPQANTEQLTASGDRNPKAIVFQNGQLWFSQAVNCEGRSAVQWIQLNPNGSIHQRGLIRDTEESYIQTTLAVNQREDVLVGFQATSKQMYISPRLAWRAADDPPGTLREPISMGEGQAATDGTSWGDYSGSVVDGDNGIDLWTIQSVAGPDGKNDCIIARIQLK